MTISEKLKRLESMIPKESQEAQKILHDLQLELKCCDRTCKSFEQTDSLTPIAGRCKQVEKGGSKAVVFEGDECLLDATMKQDAA